MTTTGPEARKPPRYACQECGEARPINTVFCSSECRKVFNNRRMVRGAELYDLFMCNRFEREEAKAFQVWTLMTRLAAEFREDDLRRRGGRRTWRTPRAVLDSHPSLLALRVWRG